MDNSWKKVRSANILKSVFCWDCIRSFYGHDEVFSGDPVSGKDIKCALCGSETENQSVILEYYDPDDFGYLWKGTPDSPDVEYLFFSTPEDAKAVFDACINENPTNSYTYGVARFDETADNCLTPMEVLGQHNI